LAAAGAVVLAFEGLYVVLFDQVVSVVAYHHGDEVA
jgi:hypothetical protein